MIFGQTERLGIWVIIRPTISEYGYWRYRTDQNVGIGWSKKIKIKFMAGPNRPKNEYWPDHIDQKTRIGQTKQTKLWVLG